MLGHARARLGRPRWKQRLLVLAASLLFLVVVFGIRARYTDREIVESYRLRQLDLARVATGLVRERLHADRATLSVIASAVREAGARDEGSMRAAARRVVAGSALASQDLSIDVVPASTVMPGESLMPGVVMTTERGSSRIVLFTEVGPGLRLTLTRPASAVLESAVHARVPNDRSTARSDLVRLTGDSVQILMSAGPDTTGRPAITIAPLAGEQSSVGQALRTRERSGRGSDLWGREVLFAIDTLGGDVLLVRQRDVRELSQGARPLVIVDGIVVSVGSWLLIALLTLGYRLTRMRRERDLVQLRSEFVAGVSHELRTPLTQIRLFAQLVRDGTMSDPANVERAMRVVDTESRRLTFLVDNVLGFARIEQRAPGPSAVVTNVSRDVAEAVDTYAPVIEGKARIALTLPNVLDAKINPGSLRQIVLNLLDNAAKYGPVGQTIVVGARSERNEIVLWVQDSGPGIPAAARERVFEPFVRLSPEGSASGTGIGLAVVRELVTACGGSVSIVDNPDGGARVEVRIPRASGGEAHDERAAASARREA